MSVNVEQIMSDIKAEIKEKGYTSDMLSFNDVVVATMSGDGENFSGKEYGNLVNYLGNSYVVPVSMPLPGNPIIVFIKKLIRKFTRVTIRPISEHQTEYNAHIARAFTMIGRYMEENSAKIKVLELKLQTASKEIEKLNARIAELEESK